MSELEHTIEDEDGNNQLHEVHAEPTIADVEEDVKPSEDVVDQIPEDATIPFDEDGTINLIEMSVADPSELEESEPAAASDAQNQEDPSSPTKRGAEQWKRCTMEEVRRHSDRADLWIVMHGLIYDVTHFLVDHPGGLDVLLDLGGKGIVC